MDTNLIFMNNRWQLTFWILLFVFCNEVYAQKSLVENINNHLIKIDTNQRGIDAESIASFSKVLSGNKIIALGEETHGIKQFTDFRGDLIKYLVTNLKYKVIVLEADFYGTQALNSYINSGNVDKYYALLSTGMGIYRTPEFLNIVEWLREYNSKATQEEKVSVHGCDMQKSAAIAYLSTGNLKLSKDLSLPAKEGLRILLGHVNSKNNDAKNKLDQLVHELSQELLLLPDSSVLARSIKTILQYDQYFREKYNYKRSIIRDKSMAQNVFWIYEHEKRKPTILLAHNGHISKSPVSSDIRSMGSYLKEIFDDTYYVLGMAFFEGSFSAGNVKTSQLEVFQMTDTKNTESSEYVFSQCRFANFMLDFNQVSKNAIVSDFLSKRTYSRNIGATYNPTEKQINNVFMPLRDRFDGITFFRNVTPLPFPFRWDKK